MKSYLAGIVTVSALVAAATADLYALQGSSSRDFDAEIRTAVQSAKTAAGVEFLGTLSRLCLLPQSSTEDTSDNVPEFVAKPSSAPARETWYADPARVFDNLYFVGGKVHSAWALTTSDGIILIDTIFPYNSEEHQVCPDLARSRRPYRWRRDAAKSIRGTRGDGRRGLGCRCEVSEQV
jgi:hypothetical protein